MPNIANNLNELPDELIILIVGHLQLLDVFRLSWTTKRFRTIVQTCIKKPMCTTQFWQDEQRINDFLSALSATNELPKNLDVVLLMGLLVGSKKDKFTDSLKNYPSVFLYKPNYTSMNKKLKTTTDTVEKKYYTSIAIANDDIPNLLTVQGFYRVKIAKEKVDFLRLAKQGMLLFSSNESLEVVECVDNPVKTPVIIKPMYGSKAQQT